MKLQFVIALIVHLFAAGLVRLVLWLGELQIGLPEGVDPQIANSWFNATSLTIFMYMPIRYCLQRLRRKDERIEELTNKMIEIMEKQGDFINKTFTELVEKP
mgnify:CR=1 FL=1